MGEVIPLRPDNGYDGQTCPSCGSAWFRCDGITFDQDGSVTSYAFPIECRECGEPVPTPAVVH